MGTALMWLVLVVAVGFVLHCPILKPWFGFRKPPGHGGRWFE
jgi:uncharacterized iron-regulated membrane protein